MSRHGIPFPRGPMAGPATQPIGLQVAAPLNDYQILGLMAAVLMAGQPLPTDAGERNAQAGIATERALDLLGHAAYKTGRGLVAGTIQSAQAMGMEHAKAALEAEEQAQRGEGAEGAEGQPALTPESKIITEEEL